MFVIFENHSTLLYYYHRLLRCMCSTAHILYTHNECNIHHKNEKCEEGKHDSNTGKMRKY